MSAPAPEVVDAWLAPLEAGSGLLLAISGGPDSIALLLLVAEWAKRRGAPPIHAATVDHGLRPESAREAADVAALCARLGIAHASLPWLGPKPKTRLQERARDARYQLLFEHARSLGANMIVTAHHLDDQAETVLFRLTRGSGIAGLAGMATMTPREGLILARPLLETPKSTLIEICEASGEAYARDPSNLDRKYARARLRGMMGALAEEGLDARALSRLAGRAARVEAALADATTRAEARLRLIETSTCESRDLFAESDEVVRRLLSAAIARVGGQEPGYVALEKMEKLVEALRAAHRDEARFSANVAGARVTRDTKGRIHVGPEPARRAR